MEQVFRDIRFALRQLVQQPFISLVSVLALGLGIGAVTTQLSVLDAIAWKGLPFPDSDRLVDVSRENVLRDDVSSDPTVPEFLEWQKRQDAFEGLAAYYGGTVNLSAGDLVKRYDGSFLTGNALSLLGVEADIGRVFTEEDDRPGGGEVILISGRIWREDFDADPDILGTPVIVNGRPATIAGVLPDGFGFPTREDVYVCLFRQQNPDRIDWNWNEAAIDVFGRLREGVTIDQAVASMRHLARLIEEEHPETNEGFRQAQVEPLFKAFMGGETITMTAVMMLITILILVIACANVANLLMARSMRRRKEVAIRSALGATRGRIIAQFLTESILLAFLGAIIGFVQAYYNIEEINRAQVEIDIPSWLKFTLDGRVLFAAILVTMATGILSGLVPALRASRLEENEILKDSNRTGTSLHLGNFSRLLVIIQISVAAVVLTLVVLFVKSMNNALALDYAYNPDEVVSARIGLFDELYPDDRDRRRFTALLLERLQSHPVVAAAAMTDRYQFTGIPRIRYRLEGQDGPASGPEGLVGRQRVSGRFLETLRLPLLRGAGFDPAQFNLEVPTQAIINQAFAGREWQDIDPIGKRFRADILFEDGSPSEWPLLEVVGVVGDMQESGIFEGGDGAAFIVPMAPVPYPNFITVLVRGSDGASALAPLLREEVAALDRNLPLYAVGTPREINSRSLAQFEFFASIFVGFGSLATLLAGLGIYGVITFSVNQRIIEFGIRKALGANRGDLLKLIYLQAAKQLFIGYLIALVVLSPLILMPSVRESLGIFFYGIDPDSLVPYFSAFGFVTLIALLSATPPAIRAARIHPAEALRHE